MSFPGAVWQVAGREALPPAPPSLAAYNVKDRLVSRWREVHAEEGAKLGTSGAAPPDQEQGAGSSGRAASGSGAGPGPCSAKGATAKTGAKGGKGKGGADAGAGTGDFVSAEQQALFAALHSYADVTLPARAYPSRLEDPGGCSHKGGVRESTFCARCYSAVMHVGGWTWWGRHAGWSGLGWDGVEKSAQCELVSRTPCAHGNPALTPHIDPCPCPVTVTPHRPLPQPPARALSQTPAWTPCCCTR